MKNIKNSRSFKQERKRNIIQALASFATNANIMGFFKGRIYTGPTKVACVPGLNCYSCPGAVGACPIGSLQAVIGGRKFSMSYYIAGIMIFFGAMFGRLVCGFMCPFGFVQDLLYKIPVKKFKIPPAIDRVLRYLKYVILALFVIIFPLLLTNQFGMAPPYFCKFICPAGAFGGAIPLISTNPGLRNTIGFLFFWKMGILLTVVLLSIFTYRPFCKYLCPLGAFYAFFNKIGFYKMQLNQDKCVGCGLCEKACKMDIKVRKDINSLECIRCGACKAACAHGAITVSFAGLERIEPAKGKDKSEKKGICSPAACASCPGCAKYKN
jgi:4Fe-4S ferredoxin iron-sulfur binding domain-containing protein